MPKPVYLDYHATTPVDPRVLEAMLPFFTERFGNPASRQHAYGWEARRGRRRARGEVASLINATAGEITFTSGATESSNLALKGAAHACRDRGDHVVTVATEHKSVLDSFKTLEREGWRVTRLGVDAGGFIDLDALRAAVTDKTILVSVMAANNEIGIIQPLAEIGAIVSAAGALLHTDAAQAAGKVPIDVRAMNIDLLSLTAHKFYGPKGSGALFVRRKKPRLELACQIDGGGQEHGLRSGTLNVPGIVGLGRAAEICRLEMAEATRLGGAARSSARGTAPRARRRARQRLARAPPAAQPARQLREGRRRSAADGARRPRRLDRVRLQLRQPGPVARARGHRRRRRERRRLDPLRPRPHDDRRRHRFRDRPRLDRRQEPATAMAVQLIHGRLRAQGSGLRKSLSSKPQDRICKLFPEP